MPAHLRLYSETLDSDQDEAQDPAIRIRLADLLPLLAFAKKNNYLWLKDFLEDEVTVTPDLYEVLRSFSAARAPHRWCSSSIDEPCAAWCPDTPSSATR